MLTFPQIDPVAVSIGPFAVHWYGLAYVASFLAALWYVKWRARQEVNGPVKPDDFEALFTWVVIGIILGGRLGYVLFYNLPYYIEHPIDIIKTWNGGMSFHGGLLGTLLACWLFARKRSIHFFDLMDRVAPSACIGLFLGRLANFINGELFGRTTDFALGMVFPGGGPEPRHASQLYEAALEGVVLFIILHLVSTRRWKRYEISGLFALGYGVFRFMVEFVREPDPLPNLQGGIFEWVTMGQVLSIPLIAVGIFLLYLSYRKPKAV